MFVVPLPFLSHPDGWMSLFLLLPARLSRNKIHNPQQPPNQLQPPTTNQSCYFPPGCGSYTGATILLLVRFISSQPHLVLLRRLVCAPRRCVEDHLADIPQKYCSARRIPRSSLHPITTTQTQYRETYRLQIITVYCEYQPNTCNITI